MCLLISILIKIYYCFRSRLCQLFTLTRKCKAQGSKLKVNFDRKVQSVSERAQSSVTSTKLGAVLSIQHLIFFLTALLFVLCVMPLPVADAAQVTLGWDKRPEADIKGYKIHYGTISGNYDYSVDVGNQDSCTVSGLVEGQTYYFAATSYNTDNFESVFSTELVYTIPASQPDTSASEPNIPDSEMSATQTDGNGGTEVTTFYPVADATVRIKNPSRNYGSLSYLEVDASSEKIAYLRFDVSGLSGSVVSAHIQLECINASSFGGTIYAISNNSWQELTVTWDNRPGIDGLVQDTMSAVSVGDIVQLDVTALVTGNGIYNFAMDSDSKNGADYYSREGLNPPALIIITDAAEDTTGNESPPPTDIDVDKPHIPIEAEDAQINYPFEYGRDGEASSEGFIWVPDRAGNVWNPTKAEGYAEFIFEVPQAGNYVIWGRVIAGNGGNNSFFVSMDDGNYALWSTAKSKKWIWDQINSRGDADPVVLHLEVGRHTLMIKQREDGTKLDKILITNDLGYMPQGTGD